MAQMFRHILLIRLKPGVTSEQVDAFARAITDLPFPGRQNVVIGRDTGDRPGSMRFDLTPSTTPDERR